ncbi:uncharacterized protein [Watersipora subatra]|uniref:uncharacterized protein n=1 Tax=Watersipora subatra TaxID=2589382 RepID=UPI00355AE012
MEKGYVVKQQKRNVIQVLAAVIAISALVVSVYSQITYQWLQKDVDHLTARLDQIEENGIQSIITKLPGRDGRDDRDGRDCEESNLTDLIMRVKRLVNQIKSVVARPSDRHSDSGLATGQYYTHKGGSSVYACFLSEPEYNSNLAGDQGNYIYRAEYQTNSHIFPSCMHDQNVPCSRCYLLSKSTTIMIPAKRTCPSS